MAEGDVGDLMDHMFSQRVVQGTVCRVGNTDGETSTTAQTNTPDTPTHIITDFYHLCAALLKNHRL